MRALFLILMIALMPLRMWAADDMSMRMAAPGSAMPADCPMAAHAADDAGALDSAPAEGAGCQLCGALAAPAVAASLHSGAPGLLPHPPATAFRSVPPRLDHKPPIS